jgi:GGDEF domain-containing protein
VDDFVHMPLVASELVVHVKAILRREIKYDPITHLPSVSYLHRVVDARLMQNQALAVAYADIDHFRAYQEVYGQLAADRALIETARLLVDVLPRGSAVAGHLDNDDFMAVLPPEGVETFAQTLVDQFKALHPRLYDKRDWERGYFELRDDGEGARRPLMTLSVALVTNQERALTNYAQVSALLIDLMRELKLKGGGKWIQDGHLH